MIDEKYSSYIIKYVFECCAVPSTRFEHTKIRNILSIHLNIFMHIVNLRTFLKYVQKRNAHSARVYGPVVACN
jgi:hypothetical protein